MISSCVGESRRGLIPRAAMSKHAICSMSITISPDFAAAYALIAYTHAVDYANGWGENAERSLQTSLEIAGRAVQLNDEDPEAHVDFAVASRVGSRARRALPRRDAASPWHPISHEDI